MKKRAFTAPLAVSLAALIGSTSLVGNAANAAAPLEASEAAQQHQVTPLVLGRAETPGFIRVQDDDSNHDSHSSHDSHASHDSHSSGDY